MNLLPSGIVYRNMKTQDARTLSPQSQEDLRFRVVRAIVEQGVSQAEAVRTFGVGKTAVHNWLTAYRKGGEKSLRSKKRGRKKGSKLLGHEAATIVRLIRDRCPDQLYLPFVLWTRDAVQELIHRRTGKHFSVWTVGRYLKKWGFTPQKPVRRAYERDPEAVQQWLDNEYPAISRRAKRENAEIHWGDEMGMRSDHQAGTSYGLKGKTPTVPGTGRRFGFNMISTITNRGKLTFMCFKKRFTGKVMIRFLRRLIRQAKRKVFLIVDGHPVHRSALVNNWIEAHSKRISLFRLPGYSPELNPDELLNQDVKTNAVGRQRPNSQSEMLKNVRSYLRRTQRQPDIVIRYFKHEDVAYAA